MKYKLIVIGGSAGSLSVLMDVLPALGENFSVPVILVLHRKKTPDSHLAELLSSKTTLDVKEVEEKENIRPGHIYLAPPDYHLLIEQDRSLSLDFSEKVNFSRPSIDVTFQAAADVYGDELISILLSGANDDGVAGLLAVKSAGGLTIVQDPETSEVSYMPQQAVERAAPDYIIQTRELADFIKKIVKLKSPNLL